MKCLFQIEIVILELILKKFKIGKSYKMKSVPDVLNYKYHASIIGQKVILLNKYDQIKWPLLYPLFDMSPFDTMRI